eukprot:9847593-Heterocapsa_arctica.AAC.1
MVRVIRDLKRPYISPVTRQTKTAVFADVKRSSSARQALVKRSSSTRHVLGKVVGLFPDIPLDG